MQDHINNLVRNIREQAAQQAREDLAVVWKWLRSKQLRDVLKRPEDLRRPTR